jgi:hypothetical protein
MKDKSRSRIFRKAIMISVVLNAVMALCGTVSNLVRPLAWLSLVSRAIAAPPSLILSHVFSQKQRSLGDIVALEIGGMLFCLLLYALLAGLALWLLSRRAAGTREG